MTFKVIRGQGQAEEMTSVPYRDYFFVCLRDWMKTKEKVNREQLSCFIYCARTNFSDFWPTSTPSYSEYICWLRIHIIYHTRSGILKMWACKDLSLQT